MTFSKFCAPTTAGAAPPSEAEPVRRMAAATCLSILRSLAISIIKILCYHHVLLAQRNNLPEKDVCTQVRTFAFEAW